MRLFKLILPLSCLLLASCANDKPANTAADSTAALHDTSSVIKPPIQESSGIVHTPAIADSNAVIPDSSVKSK